MAIDLFCTAVCKWRQGMPGHTPGKEFCEKGVFYGAVAAQLNGSTHVVNGITIVRRDSYCNRRGQW